MRSKEWRDIQIPLWSRLAISLIFLVIPLLSKRSGPGEILFSFYIGFGVTAIWAVNHMGLNAFSCEFRDQAFEYLFTFPCSRAGLLLRKLLPRLAFLAILLLIFTGIHRMIGITPESQSRFLQNSPFNSPLRFALWLMVSFFSGFFLSLFYWGNWRATIPLGILIVFSLIDWGIGKLFFSPDRSGSAGVSIPLVLTILGAGFLIRWSRIGLRQKSGRTADSPPTAPPSQRKYRSRRFRLGCRDWLLQVRNLLVILPVIALVAVLPLEINDTTLKRTDLVVPSLGLMLLIFSFSSGLNLFSREFRDHALEYLLTFPINRWQLLGQKVAARLLVLGPATLVYTLLATRSPVFPSGSVGVFSILLHPGYFPIWTGLLFLCGLFMSLFEMKNAMAAVNLAVFLPLVLLPMAMVKAMHAAWSVAPATGVPMALSTGLAVICLVLGWFFYRVYSRYDLAAPLRYSGSVSLWLISIFVGISLVSLTAILII